MKINIEFSTDGSAFEDHFQEELLRVLGKASSSIITQLRREDGCLCTHPEAADVLLDVNGNVIGSVTIVDRYDYEQFDDTISRSTNGYRPIHKITMPREQCSDRKSIDEFYDDFNAIWTAEGEALCRMII